VAIADPDHTAVAEQFLNRTTEALDRIAHNSPEAFAALCRDVDQILLWFETPAWPYQRFQRAILVPPPIGLEAAHTHYTAWLLAASGLEHGWIVSCERAEEYISALPPEITQAARIWLSRCMAKCAEASAPDRAKGGGRQAGR
jgi:hypothetical protein